MLKGHTVIENVESGRLLHQHTAAHVWSCRGVPDVTRWFWWLQLRDWCCPSVAVSCAGLIRISYRIQELNCNINLAVAAIDITMLHPVYLNMVTARMITNCSDTLRNTHTNPRENITRKRLKRKVGYFFVAHPVYIHGRGLVLGHIGMGYLWVL